MLPEALLLDLDGTLVDSEAFHTESIVRFLARHGVDLDGGERAFVVGHAWQEIYEHLRVRERLGISLAQLQRGSVDEKPQMIADGHGMRVLPGARDLVAWARDRQIPVAIVSGSSREEIGHALELLQFEDSLEFYMGAEDVERGKPDPEGYAAAAARLGVTPARCLVFEDSEAGIASGKAAGMVVVATSAVNLPAGQAGHQDQSGADVQLAGLDGIEEIDIERWMGPSE